MTINPTTLVNGEMINGLNKINSSYYTFALTKEIHMVYKKPMPTIRPSSESSIQYAIEKIFKVGRVGFPYRNCLNCIYWQVEPDKCGKFNSKPPTEIIVYSCEAYEDNDDIPF